MGWPNFPRIYMQLNEERIVARNLDNGEKTDARWQLPRLDDQGRFCDLGIVQKAVNKAIRSVSKLSLIIRPKIILHWTSVSPISTEQLRTLGVKSGAREVVVCKESKMSTEELLGKIDWCKSRL